jgi:thioredoxin 1
VEAEGLTVADITKEIGITRMDCPTCIVTLEKSVMKVSGVKKAQGNYLKKTIRVTYNEATSLAAIERAIEDVGYQVAYKKYPSPLSKLRGLFSRNETEAITAISDADFPTRVLHSTKPVVVLFGSDSCPSCRLVKPQLNELVKKQGGSVDFYELDITSAEVWKEYNVMGIPTVIIFRDGRPAERFGAILDVDKLEKALTK